MMMISAHNLSMACFPISVYCTLLHTIRVITYTGG